MSKRPIKLSNCFFKLFNTLSISWQLFNFLFNYHSYYWSTHPKECLHWKNFGIASEKSREKRQNGRSNRTSLTNVWQLMRNRFNKTLTQSIRQLKRRPKIISIFDMTTKSLHSIVTIWNSKSLSVILRVSYSLALLIVWHYILQH